MKDKLKFFIPLSYTVWESAWNMKDTSLNREMKICDHTYPYCYTLELVAFWLTESSCEDGLFLPDQTFSSPETENFEHPNDLGFG